MLTKSQIHAHQDRYGHLADMPDAEIARHYQALTRDGVRKLREVDEAVSALRTEMELRMMRPTDLGHYTHG